MREIGRQSARAENGWSRAKDLCNVRPAPFDAYFDSINMMGPINVLRGTREAADFFDEAVKEFEEMVAEGKGPLPEERFRIVTEGPPPYPYYRNFRNLFSKWGAVSVASTYSTVGRLWEHGFRHDPDHPLESIAEQMLVYNLTTARSWIGMSRSRAMSSSGMRMRSSSTRSRAAGSSRPAKGT